MFIEERRHKSPIEDGVFSSCDLIAEREAQVVKLVYTLL